MGSDRPFLIYCHQALDVEGLQRRGDPEKLRTPPPEHSAHPSSGTPVTRVFAQGKPGGRTGEGSRPVPPGRCKAGPGQWAAGTRAGGCLRRPTHPPAPGGLGRRLRAGFQAAAWRSPGIGPRALCGAAAGDRSARPREQPALPRPRPAPSPAPASGRGTPVPTRRAPCRPGSAHSPAHSLVGRLLRG